MRTIEHTNVEMEDGPFTANIFETDGELIGFRLTYLTPQGGKAWWEMTRAELVGLSNFLKDVLAEADAPEIEEEQN